MVDAAEVKRVRRRDEVKRRRRADPVDEDVAGRRRPSVIAATGEAHAQDEEAAAGAGDCGRVPQ